MLCVFLRCCLLRSQGSELVLVVGRSSTSSGLALLLSGGGGVDVDGASLPLGTGIFDAHTVQWSIDPYLWAGSDRALVPVTTVEVTDPEDGSGVTVADAPSPIVVSFPLPLGTDVDTFRCSFWDRAAERWSDKGMVLLGFTSVAGGNGSASLTASCATLHLSDFTGVSKSVSFFVVTQVDPIGDAGSLADVANPRNLLALVVVVGIVGVFFVTWNLSVRLDEARSQDLHALQRAHMLLFGEVRTGLGMHCLHLPLDHPGRARVKKMYDALMVRCTAAAGGGQGPD